MRISDIKNVVTIEQYKSFSKAAAILHISQSALSQSIQRLEKNLDCKLLRREKSGVFLTSDGEVFVQEGKRILGIYSEMLSHLSGTKSHMRDRIVIGASPMYSKHFFPKIYSEFSYQYPSIDLRLVEALSTRLWNMLRNNEIDLAITSAPPQEMDLETRSLYQERVVFAVPRSIVERKQECFYEKEGKQYVDLHGFRNESFLSYIPTNTMCAVTNAVCREYGFEPNIVFTTGNPEVLSSMVACGMGVGFLPSLSLRYSVDVDHYRFFYVESQFVTREYNIVLSEKARRSEACECFIDLCQLVHAKAENHSKIVE